MKWLTLVVLAVLLLSDCHGMGNKNNNNNNNKNNKKKAEKVVFYPCGTSVLKEERVIGGNVNKQRMWTGYLDISSVTQSDKVIVTMIFNFPVNFQIVSQTRPDALS